MAKKDSDAQGAAKLPAGPERVKRTAAPAANFVTLYTNDTQVQITPWDLRITFGEITDLPTSERREIVIKTTGEVRMSPQHAKRLADLLIGQIARYERNFGAIPMPKELRGKPNGASEPEGRPPQ